MHFADCIFFLLKLESTVEKKATYFVWGKSVRPIKIISSIQWSTLGRLIFKSRGYIFIFTFTFFLADFKFKKNRFFFFQKTIFRKGRLKRSRSSARGVACKVQTETMVPFRWTTSIVHNNNCFLLRYNHQFCKLLREQQLLQLASNFFFFFNSM